MGAGRVRGAPTAERVLVGRCGGGGGRCWKRRPWGLRGEGPGKWPPIPHPPPFSMARSSGSREMMGKYLESTMVLGFIFDNVANVTMRPRGTVPFMYFFACTDPLHLVSRHLHLLWARCGQTRKGGEAPNFAICAHTYACGSLSRRPSARRARLPRRVPDACPPPQRLSLPPTPSPPVPRTPRPRRLRHPLPPPASPRAWVAVHLSFPFSPSASAVCSALPDVPTMGGNPLDKAAHALHAVAHPGRAAKRKMTQASPAPVRKAVNLKRAVQHLKQALK